RVLDLTAGPARFRPGSRIGQRLSDSVEDQSDAHSCGEEHREPRQDPELRFVIVLAELDPAELGESDDDREGDEETDDEHVVPAEVGDDPVLDARDDVARPSGIAIERTTIPTMTMRAGQKTRGAISPLPRCTPWRRSFSVIASSVSLSPMCSFSGRWSSTGSGSPNRSCSSGPNSRSLLELSSLWGSLIATPHRVYVQLSTLPYSSAT